MRVIFYDTNMLYGAYRYFLLHQRLSSQSILKKICKDYQVYISTFVAKELHRIMPLSDEENMVQDFCGYVGIKIIPSLDIKETTMQLVFDPFDAQILQDAINIQADILLTHNTKDFDIVTIWKRYHISITNTL